MAFCFGSFRRRLRFFLKLQNRTTIRRIILLVMFCRADKSIFLLGAWKSRLYDVERNIKLVITCFLLVFLIFFFVFNKRHDIHKVVPNCLVKTFFFLSSYFIPITDDQLKLAFNAFFWHLEMHWWCPPSWILPVRNGFTVQFNFLWENLKRTVRHNKNGKNT